MSGVLWEIMKSGMYREPKVGEVVEIWFDALRS